MPDFECAITEGVATLTLNRPFAYNALSLQLMRDLHAQLHALDANQEVRVLILCGAGRGFCAGHDLKELQANRSEAFYKEVFDTCGQLMMALQKIRQPVIAAVHGMATAAGCQLVASCDLAVASTDAHFATPGVNIGLFCSTPMVALTRSLSSKHAMSMLLTGDSIDAEQAQAIGLINAVAAAKKQYQAALDLAQKIIEKAPLALAIGKKAFYQQREMGIADAYRYCSETMTKNMLTLDAQEGIRAQLEKRPAIWQGC